jgi:hypothetical protein
MKAATWRSPGWTAHSGKSPTAAVLAASIMLAQCAAVPVENATQPAPPATYGLLIANQLKTFKGFADYSSFAISGLRWIDTATGWSWLACVRYLDHGRQRYYSFFIKDAAVVNSRYDVRTDQCPAQQYAPFDVATGTVAAAVIPEQPAPGPLSPAMMLQQPIY